MAAPKKHPVQESRQPSAKLASNFANQAAQGAFSAVDSTRQSAETVVKIGTNAVRELFASGAGEAEKAQKKVFAIGRESAENIAKGADAVTKLLTEVISSGRENIGACIECGNLTSDFAQEIGGDISEYANQAFATQMEISKDAFACRTINDVLELQNKVMKQSIEGFFSESMKLSEKIFEYASEALEPINNRVTDASDRLQKVLSA